MSSRTAEANAKLEEQGKIAQKTNEELKKLTGNDKKSAIEDLTAAFAAQNIQLGKSKEAVDAVLFAIRAASVENEKARKVTEDARRGVISYDEAIKRLNEMEIPTDLYDMLKKQAKEYDVSAAKANTSKVAFKAFGIEVKLAGNEAQNTSSKIAGNTKELNANETAAQKAARAQQGFKDSLYDREYEAYVTKGLLAKGYSEEQVKAMVDAANYAKKEGIQITNEMYQAALKVVDIEQKNKDVIDARNEAEKKITKEKEKRYQYTQAELKMLQKVATLSAKHDLDGIGAKYGIPKNYLAGLMAQESKGNPNAVSPTGAIGYYQTTNAYRKDNGLSVADSKNLPVIAEVVAKNLAKAYKELGDWEAAIRSHNAGLAGSAQFAKSGKVKGSAARNKEVANFAPSVNKWIVGLGGSALKNKGSADAIDDLKQYSEFLKEQANLQKSLELDVANEVTKIRENLKDKLEEIDKAGFSPERTKELKAEYQARADNDIAIANYALKTKLDDYGAFKKTESELLKQSFDERKFYAACDIELTKDQRNKAVKLLDEQLKQEQALILLSQETQLFQAKQAYMHEVDLMQERYRLEMQEIDKITDAKQRAAMREVTAARFADDYEKKRKAAQDNSDSLIADLTGQGDLYALQKQMADREAILDEARKYGILKEREYKAALIEIEKRYIDAKRSLNLSYGEQIANSMSAMFKQQGDEQNKYYKAAITIEKSFAIARSMIAIQAGIAQAANNPWPLNLAAMATVAAQTASIVSNIQAIHTEGFKAGGYTGNYGTSDVAGVVHGQEYVLNAAATKRVGVGTLDAINSGKGLGEKAAVVQPKIIINTLPGQTANVSTADDGTVTIDMVEQYIVNSLQQPNSKVRKALAQNTNATARR
ncbi:transglycosylase SLT domain-containing protein [Acinetobacter sp. ANC 3781]